MFTENGEQRASGIKIEFINILYSAVLFLRQALAVSDPVELYSPINECISNLEIYISYVRTYTPPTPLHHFACVRVLLLDVLSYHTTLRIN